MQKHTRVYMEFFNYGIDDLMPCEITWYESNGELEARAVDIHHVNKRGKGKDTIENLIGVTRQNHDRCENKLLPYITKEKQLEIHQLFMKAFGERL